MFSFFKLSLQFIVILFIEPILGMEDIDSRKGNPN